MGHPLWRRERVLLSCVAQVLEDLDRGGGEDGRVAVVIHRRCAAAALARELLMFIMF